MTEDLPFLTSKWNPASRGTSGTERAFSPSSPLKKAPVARNDRPVYDPAGNTPEATSRCLLIAPTLNSLTASERGNAAPSSLTAATSLMPNLSGRASAGKGWT